MKGNAITKLDKFLLDCEDFDNSQREAIIEFTMKLEAKE